MYVYIYIYSYLENLEHDNMREGDEGFPRSSNKDRRLNRIYGEHRESVNFVRMGRKKRKRGRERKNM